MPATILIFAPVAIFHFARVAVPRSAVEKERKRLARCAMMIGAYDAVRDVIVIIRQTPPESPQPSGRTAGSETAPGANAGRKVRSVGQKKTR